MLSFCLVAQLQLLVFQPVFKKKPTLVFYICIGFWLFAHLTRDLSQAEKKMSELLQAEQVHKITAISLTIVKVIVFIENTGHLSIAQLVATVILFSVWH